MGHTQRIALELGLALKLGLGLGLGLVFVFELGLRLVLGLVVVVHGALANTPPTVAWPMERQAKLARLLAKQMISVLRPSSSMYARVRGCGVVV